MGYTKLALAALVVLSIANADPYEEFRSNIDFRSETNLDDPAYRLRDYVQPLYQYVDLDVYLEENRFVGVTRIEVNITAANLNQIVLHQNVPTISSATLLDSNNQPVALRWPGPFQTDNYYEILMINTEQVLPEGQYTITINYIGQINENPVDRGFYKGYYFLNGEKRYYATTQFQPYHARKAFPCFDEPQFKNPFVISITRDSSLSQSYSNMAISLTENVTEGRVKETFLPTPTISAYLIAFHVSDFVETTIVSATRPVGIISRPGVTAQHEYARNMAASITAWMDEYFDFNYYTMGQGNAMKNDHIALPDFPSGAMENWGMVNYREAYLLNDPQNTNLINRIFIATIISHEMAHKWFGNLVTCFWWSNLWLNESFATIFEYFATHGVDPSLELADQYIVDYVHSALTADASAAATPMNWTGVVTNPSISSHFSTTSYAKGGSVLRMMEHFVTPTTFRNALRHYLRDNQYQLGTPNAMYAAFRTAVAEDNPIPHLGNIDVGAVFDTWVQNPGAPVLEVDVDMNSGDMTIVQRRFQLTGVTPDTLWQIPITYTTGSNPDFTNTLPVQVLTERSTVINKGPGHEWVIFNIAQSGYYRVKYDDHTYEMIASALRQDPTVIHKLNRAQIVNDILFFIRAGTIEIDKAFNVLSYLAVETDYYPWAAALSQLDYIRRRIEHIPAVKAEYDDWLSETMEEVIDDLGYNEVAGESTSRMLNRVQIMNYACNNLGHEDCVSDSLAKWRAFRTNPSQLIPPNLRRHVYCVGLREGDYSDYEFLWSLYSSSQNTADMVVMLRALACTKNQTSIMHYLDETMRSDLVRIHDKTNAFSYALQGNPENLQTVLEFLRTRDPAAIRELYGGSARVTIAINALSTYLTNFEDIVSFQTWLYGAQRSLESDEFAAGRGVITTSINNLNWGNNVAVDLITTIRGRSSAVNVMASISLILTAVVARILF